MTDEITMLRSATDLPPLPEVRKTPRTTRSEARGLVSARSGWTSVPGWPEFYRAHVAASSPLLRRAGAQRPTSVRSNRFGDLANSLWLGARGSAPRAIFYDPELDLDAEQLALLPTVLRRHLFTAEQPALVAAGGTGEDNGSASASNETNLWKRSS